MAVNPTWSCCSWSTPPEALDPGSFLQLGLCSSGQEETAVSHILFHDVLGQSVFEEVHELKADGGLARLDLFLQFDDMV